VGAKAASRKNSEFRVLVLIIHKVAHPASNPRSPMKTPSSTAPFRFKSRGFTLIELLTVIAIIGILAAILIPVVGKVRKTAKIAKNISNLRALSGPFFLYAQDNHNLLPRARDNDTVRKKSGAWPAHLIDYIQDLNILIRPGAEDGDGLINEANSVGSPGPTTDASGKPITWSYVINGGGNPGFPFPSNGGDRVSVSRIERPSQTMMLADAPGYTWWFVGANTLPLFIEKIRFEDGRTTMLFFDGHVARPTEDDLTLDTFRYKL